MKEALIILVTLSSLFFITINETSAQIETKNQRELEVGVDFIRFNNYSNPFGVVYHPDNGKEFKFDFIPAIFFRIPFGKNSFRFKYEYSQLAGSYSTKSLDFSSHVDGNLVDNRVLIGIERYFTNSRFKFYGLVDIGLSLSNFKGYYSSVSGWSLEHISNESQNIEALGISANPGIGIKYQILKKISLTAETSVGVEKYSKKKDPHNIYVPSKLILRPISLIGVSYTIIRNK